MDFIHADPYWAGSHYGKFAPFQPCSLRLADAVFNLEYCLNWIFP